MGADETTKTGSWRVVPVPRAVQRHLPRGNPADSVFPHREAQEWVKRLRRLTEDLPVFGELDGKRVGNQWHLLRSTWAVNRARAGASIWQLMAWGGWRNMQTVLRYVNTARAAGLR